MKTLAILCASLLFLACAPKMQPVEPRIFKPIDVNAYNEVYEQCSKMPGVSCSLNSQLDNLTLIIDKTASVAQTQKSISFLALYYCSLTRLQGDHTNSVTIKRPDGSMTGRPCSLVGVAR